MDECPIILAILSIGMPASNVSVPKEWRATGISTLTLPLSADTKAKS